MSYDDARSLSLDNVGAMLLSRRLGGLGAPAGQGLKVGTSPRADQLIARKSKRFPSGWSLRPFRWLK